MTERIDRAKRSRAVLIEAAAASLVDGNGAFEIQDVARRAQVSVGLAYHRFGSKAGLIAAVVDHFYDELERAIDLGDLLEGEWAAREHERRREHECEAGGRAARPRCRPRTIREAAPTRSEVAR